ncbi:tripartite tricarboxylate transporter substrate binding protein [Delftia sp. HK171]|uniref:Bug family tripartite tricarboxylate transporter substrate binding protein n=1 Tax=Delftia sp. HK171 TaxID=1920191 RepID=UPI0021AB315C|nr:tripartite tricarboxylate transporter substrate-binding protein [Delftia sp. HK171]
MQIGFFGKGLIGGQVDVIVQNPSDIVQHVKAGKMRLLASASPMRWKELPEVPTLREQGYDVEIDSWIGLAYPKGVARPCATGWSASPWQLPRAPRWRASSSQPAWTRRRSPAPNTGAEYRRKLVQGHESMGAAIKAANLPRMN